MKPLQKTGCVVITILTCIVLNLIAYSLPTTASFKNNVIQSAKTLYDEGCYPTVLSQKNARLDNFTDAIILGAVAYDEEAYPWVKMARNYVPSGQGNSVERLYRAYCTHNEPVTYNEYGRYWHGYVFFVKTLLYFMPYNTIRLLNSFIQTALFVIVLILLVKKDRTILTIPYTILWLSLIPMAVQASLQFSAMYYVFSIAIILLIYKKEMIHNGIGYPIYFMMIGVITSWLDLLTYPIITLGVPLTMLICIDNDSFQNKAKLFFSVVIMWACGYFGMWALKWFLSSAILGENVFYTAMEAIIFRTSSSYNGDNLNKVDVIIRNLSCFQYKIYFYLFAIPLVCCIINMIKNHTFPNLRDGLLNCIISMMPFAWYIVLSNHSYIHFWFTFRSLGVSIFAISCFLVNFDKNMTIGEKNGKNSNFNSLL